MIVPASQQAVADDLDARDRAVVEHAGYPSAVRDERSGDIVLTKNVLHLTDQLGQIAQTDGQAFQQGQWLGLRTLPHQAFIRTMSQFSDRVGIVTVNSNRLRVKIPLLGQQGAQSFDLML